MSYINYTSTFVIMILLLCSLHCHGQKQRPDVDTLRHIQLKEVIVTASQPDTPGSRSIIGQDAIRHIQATDLSGLTQLLPGVTTRNPNLNIPAGFTIRSASYDNTTNALGTAILVDGMRLNNNMNMQQMGLEGRRGIYNSTVLSGFDVRSISPTSVESVEVIRGIPSARYGDVTSGMVLVKSKVGIQPFSASMRFTATEKLASAGKGFRLGSNGGSLYIGGDYTFSREAPQIPEETFHRIGFQAAYAKDFRSATLRVDLRGYWMKDNDKRGNNSVDGEYQRYTNQGFSFSANGQWKVMKPWLSSLEYRAGMSYGRQKNELNTYYSGTQQVTTYTTLPGEHEGSFLPPNYFAPLSIEGEPLTTHASLIANLRKALSEQVYEYFLLGVEADMEGNRGKGISFNPSNPPLNMIGIRTRSYRDIPFVYHYSAFAENRIVVRTGEMQTELETGLRIIKLHTRALHPRPIADPRINFKQVLMDNNDNSFIQYLSLRLGWGLMHKMPVLPYLYPDISYTDKNSFTYNDTENNYRMAVMHTYATGRTFNPDLTFPVNRKFEMGINFRIADITTDIVWYNEHLKNGYCTTLQADPFSYRRYNTLIGKGEQPELTPDGVVNHGETLGYTNLSSFATYQQPQNGIKQKKQGVEYTIGPIRCRPLHSSLLISGNYMNMKEKNTTLSAFHPQIEVNGKPYPYVGIYESSSYTGNLQVWEQFNTRFQCITQLPRIGLIASLTLQAVWMDKQKKSMESRYNNPVYLTDANGNRIEGDAMTDIEHQKRLNPVYYMDASGSLYPFTAEMETDSRFSDLIMSTNTLTAFQEDSFGPYFLLNLRITKEIGRHVSVAFCANNLTQSNPKRYRNSTQQYSILNPELYYGAEINIRF